MIYALGLSGKNYTVVYENKMTGEMLEMTRCRGFRIVNKEAKQLINAKTMQTLIEDLSEPARKKRLINVPQARISISKEKKLLNILSSKVYSNEALSKGGKRFYNPKISKIFTFSYGATERDLKRNLPDFLQN